MISKMEKEKYECIYIVDKSKSHIKLLGSDFYKRNRIYGQILYNNKNKPLIDKIETKNLNKNTIRIIFIFFRDIFDKSLMFQDCESLFKFTEIINIDKPSFFKNLIDFDISQNYKLNNYQEKNINLFDDFEDNNHSEKNFYPDLNDEDSILSYSEIKIEKQKNSLISEIYDIYQEVELSDKNNLDNYKGNNTEHSSSLFSLFESSISNRHKVNDISGMFWNCSSLLSLPDISKWNTKNVISMEGVFYNCSSLKSLPDISNWKTKNVIKMSLMFSHCSSLLSLPDISKWNTNKVKNMLNTFAFCSSLRSLPDISKWKTNNVSNMNGIFAEC